MTYLIGVGAHGRDIISIWAATGGHGDETYLRLRDELDTMYPLLDGDSGGPCYLGPYDPHIRYWMTKRLPKFWPAPALVHPSSTPGMNCFLKPGVVVARNVVLDHDVELGVHTHVNYSASMTRTKVGDYCTISPGVVICGDVTIGQRVFVGAGAVITNLVNISDDAVIGAGATVLADVPAGATVMGTPARIMRSAP